MSQLKEDLLKVIEVLEPEGAWCQDRWARNAQGWGVSPTSPDCVSRCLSGALIAVAAAKGEAPRASGIVEMLKVINQRLASRPPYRYHVAWNDTPGRTQAEVLALLHEIVEEID